MVTAKRVPTDDEWTWTYDRVTGHGRYRASWALIEMVWKAVHVDGWFVSEVASTRITLRRYHPLAIEAVEVSRDRLGRFGGAVRSVTIHTDTARSLAAADKLLTWEACRG